MNTEERIVDCGTITSFTLQPSGEDLLKNCGIPLPKKNEYMEYDGKSLLGLLKKCPRLLTAIDSVRYTIYDENQEKIFQIPYKFYASIGESTAIMQALESPEGLKIKRVLLDEGYIDRGWNIKKRMTSKQAYQFIVFLSNFLSKPLLSSIDVRREDLFNLIFRKTRKKYSSCKSNSTKETLENFDNREEQELRRKLNKALATRY